MSDGRAGRGKDPHACLRVEVTRKITHKFPTYRSLFVRSVRKVIVRVSSFYSFLLLPFVPGAAGVCALAGNSLIRRSTFSFNSPVLAMVEVTVTSVVN